MVLMPLASRRSAVTSPTPLILRTESGRSSSFVSVRPMTEKPRGLLHIGGELGQEFVPGETDGDGDADLGFHVVSDVCQCLCGGTFAHTVSVSQIEIGFIQRDRLDGRCGGEEDGADVVAHALVLGHIGRDDGGIGAKLQRLEHRHRGARAELARHVAGSEHDAASAAVADDDGLIGEFGPITLLD